MVGPVGCNGIELLRVGIMGQGKRVGFNIEMALSILVFMRCKCTVNNLFFFNFGLFLYAPLRVPLRVYQPAIASCITGEKVRTAQNNTPANGRLPV